MESAEKSGLYWLCKEAENRSSAVESPEVTTEIEGVGTVKRRRGRPAKAKTETTGEVTVNKRKKKEDEDVCFICFDGGSLVLCDRGDCPKAYHPACIKRDEAFFQSKAKWNCGWHLCSECQKSGARYMCYTCTYSLCKGCAKDTDYLSVRGNKGFCSTCCRVIKMIENIDQENQETVQVDFDDKLSWEYLFKVYWTCLKTDLSLTIDEITRAQKPLTIPHKVTRREKFSAVHYIVSGEKARETSLKSVRDNLKSSADSGSWASKQLLDFVAYMRNNDTSELSQKEVQALLFDYIKRNNLRDPHQRSDIICDLKLENLFGKPRVRHFEMLSLLEFHFLTKDEPQNEEIQSGIIDPVDRQVAGESKSDNLLLRSESYEEMVDINRSPEVKHACEKLESHVDSSGSTNNGHNNQVCLKSDSLSGVKSESSVASVSTGSTPSAKCPVVNNNLQINNVAHIEHSSKCPDLEPPKAVDSYLDSPQVKNDAQMECSSTYWDPVPLEVADYFPNLPQVKVDAEIKSAAVIDSDVNHPQTINDAPVKSSSQCLDQQQPNVEANLNHLQVKNNDPVNSYSECSDPIPPKVVDTNLNHPHGKTDALMKASYENSSPKPTNGTANYWDLEPFKVVDSNPNQHQVSNDAQCKSSSKIWDSEPPRVVDSHLGQPLVNNDVQIKSYSKGWDAEPPTNVDLHLNQPQVHSVEQTSPSKEKPHETLLHQDRSKVRQMWNPTPNYENWSFQGNMVQATGRECHANQNNEHDYVGHPCSETTIIQNSWKSHEAHPQYTAMANLTDYSEEKFTISLQEFPVPMPKTSTQVLEAQNIREQQRWPPPQVSFQNLSVQNELRLTPQSTDHSEKDYFQNQKVSSLTDNFEKVRATDYKHSLLSNFPIENCSPSWSTAKGEEFHPPSPPNPVPDAPSWLSMMTEPFDFDTLDEESVSDLLANIDVMASNSDLDSPNLLMDYAADLCYDSKNDCFTSLRGLSSSQDQVKSDGLCSSMDVMLPHQSNMGDENIQPPSNDVLEPSKKSKRQPSMSSLMEVETESFEIPNNQFESRADKHNLWSPKKTRDLAEIMNTPTKYGNLNLTGSTRRESGQGTPRGSGSRNKSTLDGMLGRESSQSLFGGGGGGGAGGSSSHSRSLPRSQRVCKFYENGQCRKGAFCEDLHP